MKRLFRFQIPLAAVVALTLSACGGSSQGTPPQSGFSWSPSSLNVSAEVGTVPAVAQVSLGYSGTTSADFSISCNDGVSAAPSSGTAAIGSSTTIAITAPLESTVGTTVASCSLTSLSIAASLPALSVTITITASTAGGGSGGGAGGGSGGGTAGGSGGGASMAITDGDFESGLTGWTASGSTSLSTTAHSGGRSVQLGGTSGSGVSAISQTFVAPANVAISFWFLDTCTDTVDYAWAAASIHDNTANTTLALLADTCTNGGTWVEVSSGALPVGHNLTLTLQSKQEMYQSLYNYTLFDDVAFIYAAPAPPDAGTDAGSSDAGMDAGTVGSDAGSLYNDGGPCGSTWANYADNAFNVNCSSCHTGFSDYLDTKSDLSSIQQRIMSGSMPQGGWTNLADKQGILNWISCGAPE